MVDVCKSCMNIWQEAEVRRQKKFAVKSCGRYGSPLDKLGDTNWERYVMSVRGRPGGVEKRVKNNGCFKSAVLLRKTN